jgi:glycosyltransferase involved in cell wall biosynthesis
MFKGPVIHLTTNIGPTSFGVGQVAAYLPKAQAMLGMQPELWVLDQREVAARAAQSAGLGESMLKCFPQSRPHFLKYSHEMEVAARRFPSAVTRQTVVHQHMIWMLNSRTSLILRANGAKIVIAPHGALDGWALAKSGWKKRMANVLWEKSNLCGAHCLHATSEREVRNFRDYGLRNPIARINNGVSPERLIAKGNPAEFRDKHGITPDRRLMLFLARISRQKGLPMLLTGMATLRSMLDNWLLVVAGTDQDGHEAEVKELVEKLNLRDHVVFVGPLFDDRKLDAFAASEAFVLPSHCEGSPMIVLEAMAAGLPVMCTQAASWSELETNGCGWWPAISEEAVTACLENMISQSKSELALMGCRARNLVASDFTWNVAAERTAELYEWLHGQRDVPEFVTLR